jgi:hypothetical protein
VRRLTNSELYFSIGVRTVRFRFKWIRIAVAEFDSTHLLTHSTTFSWKQKRRLIRESDDDMMRKKETPSEILRAERRLGAFFCLRHKES